LAEFLEILQIFTKQEKMAPEIIEVPIMQVPAQMQISLKRRSDEGYNSDNSEQSENGISPTKIRKIDQGDEASKDEIEKEGETFKAKYHVRKVFYNSANGVIYTGKNTVIKFQK